VNAVIVPLRGAGASTKTLRKAVKAWFVLARWRTQRKRDGCAGSEGTLTTLQMLRRRFEPVLRHVFHFYWRFARGMTLGVRGVVLDADNRVFLVKHSYVSGWHLPGGGVDVGENFGEALARELMEEGRIALRGEPLLHGVFLNSHVSRRDHVAVYVVRRFHQDRAPEPNREIVETGFFDIADLPPDTTLGTRLRIAEVLQGQPIIATWRG
jgi:8-oxo-dGTP pyrophosphatase MutT (NUDIX family)